MLSVAEARALMRAEVMTLAGEMIVLDRAAGRVLAAPIVAVRAQPPFASSAMDGYALRAADAPGVLQVMGESAAGRGWPSTLKPGQCVRISTGAPVPDGADTIAIQEDVTRTRDTIAAPATATGRHIRRLGIDFDKDRILLPAGRALDAAALTLAAAAGGAAVCVARRPRVTLLSGGDEIVLPGAQPGPDQVFDSTRYGIAALAADAGADVRLTPLLADDRARVIDALAAALTDADLVVMIGGASVGDHDHARAAANALGADLRFDKVSVRPGKPTWFARCRGALILGLPGNPASALVTARLFMAPILALLQGADAARLTDTHIARLTHALPANGPREHYLRATVSCDGDGVQRVTAFENQDSSLMRIAAASNALLMRPPHDGARTVDERVQVLRFAVTLSS